MEQEDIETALNAARLEHLTEQELDAFLDLSLDRVATARAEAHLKICLICGRNLEMLRREASVLQDNVSHDAVS